MTTEAIDAWMSLYAACAVLALIAAVAATGRVVFEAGGGRLRPSTNGWRGRLLIVPRLWLRWHLAYLSATPVILLILLILLIFAADIGFSILVAF